MMQTGEAYHKRAERDAIRKEPAWPNRTRRASRFTELIREVYSGFFTTAQAIRAGEVAAPGVATA